MSEPTKFTPGQVAQMKTANAHGFVDCLTAMGVPKVEKGQIVKAASGSPVRVPCTTAEAVTLFEKASKLNADFQAKVAAQVDPVKAIVREHIKAAAPAAA